MFPTLALGGSRTDLNFCREEYRGFYPLAWKDKWTNKKEIYEEVDIFIRETSQEWQIEDTIESCIKKTSRQAEVMIVKKGEK